MRKILFVAVAIVSATSVQAQQLPMGPTVDVKLNDQQIQTVAHALDIMIRSEGLKSAGVVMDALSAINQAVGASQLAAVRAQVKADDAKAAK